MRFMKKLFSHFDVFSRKEPMDIPSFCLLVVNKQCNFHCRMCNMWKHTEDPESIKLPEMKKFVTDLRTFVKEPIFIHIIGGETLLWPHTAELTRHIVDTGFKTSITTNGFLINEKMAYDLVDSGMSGVFISLDSLEKEKHDYLRGTRGSFDQVQRAIQLLDQARKERKKELSIGVTFTIMEYNMRELPRYVDWVDAHPLIDAVFVNAIIQPFDSGQDTKEWYLLEKFKEVWPQNSREVHALLEVIKEKKKKGSKLCNPPEQIEVLKAYFTDPYRFRQNMRIKCTRGDLALEVNAKGDIAMCFYMPPIGNIRKDHIRDIWMSQEMKEMRNKINTCQLECDLAVNCFYKIENITDFVKS